MATIIQFPVSNVGSPNEGEQAITFSTIEASLMMPLYHGAFWRSVQELDCMKTTGNTALLTQSNVVAHWVNKDFLPARNSLRTNPQLYQSMVKLLSLKLISNR